MSKYILDTIKVLAGGWRRPLRTSVVPRSAPRRFRLSPSADGTLEQDPQQAPVVAEAFERAAEDVASRAALDYLGGLELVHEVGKRKDRPRAWTTGTVRRLFLPNLDRIGEIRWGDLPTTHVPSLQIVERSKWEAAQRAIDAPRRPARHYPLGAGAVRYVRRADGWRVSSGPIGARPSLPRAGACGCGKARDALRRSTCSPTRSRPMCAASWPRSSRSDGRRRRTLRVRWRSGSSRCGRPKPSSMPLSPTPPARPRSVEQTGTTPACRRASRRWRPLSVGYRDAAGRAARASVVVTAELVESATPEAFGELARGGLEAVVVARGRGRVAERVRAGRP